VSDEPEKEGDHRLGFQSLDAYSDNRRSLGAGVREQGVEIRVQSHDHATLGSGVLQNSGVIRFGQVDLTDMHGVVPLAAKCRSRAAR
jgi:hypothetical protein